jgi:hypothetical protein
MSKFQAEVVDELKERWDDMTSFVVPDVKDKWYGFVCS